jgi:hypothetical protein
MPESAENQPHTRAVTIARSTAGLGIGGVITHTTSDMESKQPGLAPCEGWTLMHGSSGAGVW